jgi:hypothetical protein
MTVSMHRETTNNTTRIAVARDCLVIAEVKLYSRVRYNYIRHGMLELVS